MGIAVFVTVLIVPNGARRPGVVVCGDNIYFASRGADSEWRKTLVVMDGVEQATLLTHNIRNTIVIRLVGVPEQARPKSRNSRGRARWA